MPGDAINEGFRNLDEFVCQAIPALGVPIPPRISKTGVNGIVRSGLNLVQQSAELREFDDACLLKFLQDKGAVLTAGELTLVHQIALERLGGEAHRPGAAEVAQLALEIIARRQS